MFPFPISASTARKRPHGGDAGMLFERAPGLKDASERLVAAVVKNLQKMAGAATTVEGMVSGFASDTMRNLVATHRPDSVAALIECAGVPCTLLAILDGTLVHAVVELLCGGNGAERIPTFPRAATSIDQQFAQIAVSVAAAAIQAEWAEAGIGSAAPRRIDGALSVDLCGTRTNDVGVVELALGAFGIHGTLRLVLPPAALELFAQGTAMPVDEAAAPDPLWAPLLQKELGRAPVRVEAYLEAKPLSLRAIADLRVGQILTLPTDVRSNATLVSDGRTMFRGEVGQAENRYSLRIDDIVSDLSDIAPGRTPVPASPSERLKV